jgi:hypothetical protein
MDVNEFNEPLPEFNQEQMLRLVQSRGYSPLLRGSMLAPFSELPIGISSTYAFVRMRIE